MSTATLNWSNPTTRTDGTTLASSEILEIDVFDGAIQMGTVSGAGTTFMTSLLSVGTHAFTVVVKDTTGHMSAPSNVASVNVPATVANPSAVTNLSAVLNP